MVGDARPCSIAICCRGRHGIGQPIRCGRQCRHQSQPRGGPRHLAAPDVRVAEILIKAGADEDAKNKAENTPLDVAKNKGNQAMINLCTKSEGWLSINDQALPVTSGDDLFDQAVRKKKVSSDCPHIGWQHKEDSTWSTTRTRRVGDVWFSLKVFLLCSLSMLGCSSSTFVVLMVLNQASMNTKSVAHVNFLTIFSCFKFFN